MVDSVSVIPWFRRSLALLCATATAVPLFAQDVPATRNVENPFLPEGIDDRGWPSVRGPDFDGHSPEIRIADEWPEDGPPVLWTREIGQGYSAFSAKGRRVFTQGQTLAGQYVYCFDADTGETIWEYRYEWPYELIGVYPGPRATPTLAGDRVYFAAPSGLVGCLTTDAGRLIWSRNVVDDYEGQGGTGFGYACSPTVVEGMVILPVGGPSASMVALDATDGSQVWASGDDPASYAPALPITRSNRQLVVGYLENTLVIHDRMTGARLLRLELSLGYDEHSAWPIYEEPYLWLAAPFRAGSQLQELPEVFDSAGEDTLRTVWKNRIMSNDVVSSVLVDGHVYGFDIFDVQSKTQRPSRGKFRCIDLLTGEERWSQGTGKPRRGNHDDVTEIGQAGIVVADGKLIVLNERGELLLLRATPERCDELARASVLGGELTWTPPVLHRGRVYVRNHTRAVCVYVGKPKLLEIDQPLLSVADIPQTEYVDLAAAVLAIEPEYVFDVPSTRWLSRWYFASLAILAGSALLASIGSRMAPSDHRNTTRRWIYRVSAFSAGATGTTVLGQLTQDFVFTWPVCLFVAFEPVAAAVRKRSASQADARRRRWAERLSLLVFFAVGLLYFLACRRLSLVFEWSFLIGFLGATPFLRLAQRLDSSNRWSVVFKPLLAGIAFTAFYVCGVLPLLLMY